MTRKSSALRDALALAAVILITFAAFLNFTLWRMNPG